MLITGKIYNALIGNGTQKTHAYNRYASIR